MIEIGVGSDVTINGVVVDECEGFVQIRLESLETIWIPVSDINTYHPKDEEIVEDKRRGR